MEPPMNLSFIYLNGILWLIMAAAFIGFIILCEKHGKKKK